MVTFLYTAMPKVYRVSVEKEAQWHDAHICCLRHYIDDQFLE